MPQTSLPQTPTEEFLPKIVTVLREGYGVRALRADAVAGLTVAIVALPLSMAIAIASGVGPERGLHTAIVGGFLVSLLGGSRYQIGGPAGAFIVLVSACVATIGIDGLILATLLSGGLLMLAGLMRLGTYIRYIPYPVTVGFTAGIALIILISQLHEAFGLTLAAAEPAPVIDKLAALWSARATITPAAIAITLTTVALILGLRHWRPAWPGLLIAVTVAALATALAGLPVETIATRFGDLPRMLPAPHLPLPDLPAVLAALPWAVSFALLGAIESLLSAVVADGMSGRAHRPNAELLAQGLANIGSALFGGFCVTGTIARTATNVRAGSHGPVSGMLHALFLLVFLMIAAPLAGFIPLAALAGVLIVVAWNMAEADAVRALIRSSRADALVVIVTFLLVVFRDLTEGILTGTALAGLVFIARMSDAAALRAAPPDTEADTGPAGRTDIVVCRLDGAYFFGAAARLGPVLDRIAGRPGALVLDLALVPFIDSSGAQSLRRMSRKVAARGGTLFLAGVQPAVRDALVSHDPAEPDPHFVPDTATARRLWSARPPA